MTERKTIGQLNGKWAALFKFSMVAMNVFMAAGLAWGAWVTSETFTNKSFRLKGDRVTPVEVAQLEARIIARIHELPPKDWRTRIHVLEEELGVVQKNQVKMMLILERLEKK